MIQLVIPHVRRALSAHVGLKVSQSPVGGIWIDDVKGNERFTLRGPQDVGPAVRWVGERLAREAARHAPAVWAWLSAEVAK